MTSNKTMACILVAFFLLPLAGCGGGGGGGGNSSAAPAGVFTLKATGGDGGTGSGGSGNGLYLYSASDVKMTRAGSVDASFTVPVYRPSFGTHKVTVSTDTEVQLDADEVAGGLYMISNDSNLYIGNGDGILANAVVPVLLQEGDAVVSGLHVQAGKTLKLPRNFTDENFSYLWVDQSILIDGTVTVINEGDSLDLECGALLQIGSTGTVDVSTTTAGTAGGGIYLWADGVLINQGTISADGAAGADAGPIDLQSYVHIYNTGTISANGGTNSEGPGGNADWIDLYAEYGSIFSSGTFTANGGNGTFGGHAGWIDFQPAYYEYMGQFLLGGTLESKGGNGSAGSGGHGNWIDIYNYGGGDLKMNAAITATGGQGSGEGANGGNGGSLYIEQDEAEYDYGWGGYAPAGDIYITGNIDLSGGNGAAAGGDAGYFDLYADDYTYDHAKAVSTVNLVGFSGVDVSGGNSAEADGGDAGYVEVYAYSTSYPLGVDQGGGAILNDVPVFAKGGEGATIGGQGGWVDFETAYDYSVGQYTLNNHAPIDVSGGTGDYGGNSGGVYFYGLDGLENSGAITAKGGDGTTEGGRGGYWDVSFYATLDLKNSGVITATGGAGELGGQSANTISLYAGGQVTNSAQILANGGDGTVDGGSGGYLDLFSQSKATSNSGQLNVAKGAGGTTAENGYIYLDWVDVTPATGIL